MIPFENAFISAKENKAMYLFFSVLNVATSQFRCFGKIG